MEKYEKVEDQVKVITETMEPPQDVYARLHANRGFIESWLENNRQHVAAKELELAAANNQIEKLLEAFPDAAEKPVAPEDIL